ncbi:MAG: hypothetical protein WC592_02605 [Candidatus Omnitrophota bacterium]
MGMANLSDIKSEPILLKDKEWSLIDGELCLVTEFFPMMGSSVKDGVVISPSTSAPYAKITIRCKKIPTEITAFITHSIDFANLWDAFRYRETHNKTDEILIYWSTKHYNSVIAKIISSVMLTILGGTSLPKILIMLRPNGAYEKSGSDSRLPHDINANVFIYGSLPIKCWIPDIMNEAVKH